MKEKRLNRFLISLLGVLLLLTIIPLMGYAAVPQTINYQGYLTDSGGNPIDGTVQMTFSIYEVDTGGSALWTEIQSSVTVSDGIYSVVLGSVTPITLSFNTQYYLGVQVGTDAEMTPRQPLTSVPYAMSANTAELAIDVGDAVVTTTKIVDQAVTSAKIASDAVGSAHISDGSVASADLGFNYAGSSSKGGPALDLDCIGCVSQSELDFIAGDGYSLDAVDGSPTDAVYVDNNGNVGIGTTSPQTWGSVKSRVLHMIQPSPGTSENAAAGLRLGIGDVDGGIAAAYADSGDRGVLVGTASNHRLGFITNSEERMTIAQNGNVGIGTPEPLQPLHVQGTAYVFGNLGVRTYDPTNNLQVSGDNALFQFYSAGNPFDSDTDDFRVFISKRDTDDIASLIFQNNYSGRAEVGLTADDDLHFKVSADGVSFTDAVIMDNATGNVSIGSTSWEPEGPPSKLFVLADNDTPAIWAEQFGSAPGLIISKQNSGDAMRIGKEGDPGFGLSIVQKGNNSALVISNDITEDSRVFDIRNNGSVGIGTGASDITGRLRIISAPYVYIGTTDIPTGPRCSCDIDIFTRDCLPLRRLETNDDIGSLCVDQWESTTAQWDEYIVQKVESFFVSNTGFVGIGTINPQGTLDVNGSIYQRGSQLHADYVFEPHYQLESIEEHAEYMWKNKHLTAIPEAKVDKNGYEIVEVGAHRKGIVEELEKAHIYIEQLHKHIKVLEDRLEKLEAETFIPPSRWDRK